MSHQRREPAHLPAIAGNDHPFPSAGRTGRQSRFGRLCGLHYSPLLRQPDRQADRACKEPQRVPDAAQAGARGVRGRWHRDHHTVVHFAHVRARNRRWQLRYPLAGETSRQARPREELMTAIDDVTIEITPQVLLKAYACGIFPMAESAEDNALYWIEPERRGILPLNGMHVPRRLARTIRSGVFEVKIDRNFEAVIDGCAAPRSGRRSTWINGRIRGLYRELFALGHCHTVEVWQDDALVGGLYGVHLGRAFFGESMFSRARDASKIALVYLVARLIYGGFTLLDTQFVTGHLARFGAIEVSRDEFQRLLEGALGGGFAHGNGAAASAGGAAASGASAGGASPGAASAGAASAGGASPAGTSAPGAAVFSALPEGAGGALVLQLVSQTSKTGCSTA